MNSQMRLAIVAAIIAAGGGVAAMGKLEHQIGFDSVLEMWGDLVRDADQVAMKAAPVSAADEIALGEKFSAAMKDNWPAEPVLTAYVDGVGQPLKAFLRRKEIPYHFQVVDSPSVNAFALPGGEIYVFRGLLEFVESEAELAAVLGHEMSHVDLKHCVDRYRYQLSLKRAGVGDIGQIVDMARSLATISYSQFQEVEADTQGARILIDARYDPDAAARVFTRMGEVLEGKRRPGAKTPAGEVAASTVNMVSDYFRSHPGSEDRARRLSERVRNESPRLASTRFYVGKKNLRDHIPFAEKSFNDEWMTMK